MLERCEERAPDRRVLVDLPDDGSFSADAHVAMQNTGIARTWSILLRRRRGYVNWRSKRRAPRRVPPRRGSALPPTKWAPACCILRSMRPATFTTRPRGRTGYQDEIYLFAIERDSNASAMKRNAVSCLCVYLGFLFLSVPPSLSLPLSPPLSL